MRLGVLLSVAAILLLPASALAQCKVEGVVRQPGGAPLAGATVQIEVPDPEKIFSTTTDAQGHYEFDKIKAGSRVRVFVTQSGRSVVQTFTLVTLWVETVDIDIPELSTTPRSADDLDPAGGPAGEIGGTVRTADGTPIPSAVVSIKQTETAAVTDSAGRFTFGKVRSGIILALNVTAPGFAPATKEVVVPDGTRAEEDLVLARAPGSAGGANLALLTPVPDTGRLAAAPADLTGVPSLEPGDAFRGLQFLPGVTATLEASSDLHVHGSTPGENLVTYDGFTLYPFDNLFGLYSAVNGEAIRRADFSSGAFSAADGGRLSGVLRLTGESNPTGKPTGFFDLSLLGTSALVSVPVANRASFLFALRRSFTGARYNDVLDYLAYAGSPSARDRAPRWSGGAFPISPASSFQDFNAKADVKVTAKDRVTATAYGGHDDFNNSRNEAIVRDASAETPADIQIPSDAVGAVTDVRNGTSRGMGAAWERRWSPSVSTTFSVGHSEFSLAHDQASLLSSPSTGLDYSFAAGRGGSNALSESNQVHDTTARLDTRFAIGFDHAVTVGGELTALDVNYNVRRELFQKADATAPYVPVLAPLLLQSGTGRVSTVFVQDAWRPFGRLVVTPGLRVTHYDVTALNYGEPRLRAVLRVVPAFQLHAGIGLDHQIANRLTREDLMQGDGQFWALANGTTVPVARTEHATAGFAYETPVVLVGIDGYAKTFDDLAIFAPRLYPGVAPANVGDLFHQGSGRTRGLECRLQWKADRNTLWTSYTAELLEFTFPTLEALAFAGSFDQTSEFKVLDTARLGSKWTLSAAFVAASGRPYTPATSASPLLFSSGAVVYGVTFGQKNSRRLPAYHRLDLSTERDFRIGGVKSTVGVTVFNVYDRKNVAYRTIQTIGDTVTANDVTLMGRAVNGWVRVGF
jgi:ferric enterobactin receptor